MSTPHPATPLPHLASASRLTLLASLAFLLFACGGGAGDDSVTNDGPPADQSNPAVSAPATGDPVADAVALLKAQTGLSKWQLSLVPGGLVDEVAERLQAQGIECNHLWKSHIPSYYLNQTIPQLRNFEFIWMVFDETETVVASTVDAMMLQEYVVEVHETRGPIHLAKVRNELAKPPSNRISLEPVASSGGWITDAQFVDDEVVFLALKHGDLNWRTIGSDTGGRVVTIPRSKDGGPGVFDGGESGFVGLAIHPNFPDDPRIFTHYMQRLADGSRRAHISQWTIDVQQSPRSYKARDEKTVLSIPQTHDNHNAGQLVFGPDGYLYIAVGDGEEGEWTSGRSPAGTLRGKILRIDVDDVAEGEGYSVPEDNPFVGDDSFPPETWAWGFRNPWRFGFLPDGRIVAGDIGEDVCEELTFVKRGRHHGWPFVEGTNPRNEWTIDQSKAEPPLVGYGRSFGMSVIAGGVCPDDQLPELKGKYLFADHLSGRMWTVDLPPKGADTVTVGEDGITQVARFALPISTFTNSPGGELFLAALDGKLYRILPAGVGEAPTGAGSIAVSPIDHALMRTLFSSEPPSAGRVAVRDGEVALGQALFHDAGLSSDGKVSCATCHDLERYGQDGQRVSTMASGTKTARNTPTILDAHRQFAQRHDYSVTSVEEQARRSFLHEHGLGSDDALIAAVQQRDGGNYTERFAAVYSDGLTAGNVGLAVGAYVRSLTTKSDWDAYLDGDDDALDERQQRGLSLFVAANCTVCHQYRTLGGGMPQKLGLMQPWTGDDPGRAGVSELQSDRHMFKVSPLLHVAETGPYYHDGSIATLEEAVANMAKIQLGRDLTAEDTAAIVAFLGALTGQR